MNFGDNLKKILDEKGISQRQFGFKVGKEASYISRIISGNVNVTWDTIIAFAEARGGAGVAKWERDRWSGQVWYVRYSKQFYNKKPVGGDSTKSDVAIGIWLVLFVGNIAYAVYRQV